VAAWQSARTIEANGNWKDIVALLSDVRVVSDCGRMDIDLVFPKLFKKCAFKLIRIKSWLEMSYQLWGKV
jgi:hypothetical protein